MLDCKHRCSPARGEAAGRANCNGLPSPLAGEGQDEGNAKFPSTIVGASPADKAMQTLKKRAQFQRVQKGRKWVAPAFTLYGLQRPADEADGPRFGFAVSSKSVAKDGAGGKRRGKAVDRNRARRRLKEAVRLTCAAHARAGFDYVIIGRASALTRNFADLLADIELAFHKVSQPGRSGKERNPIS